MGAFYLDLVPRLEVLRTDFLKQFKSARIDFPVLHCLLQRAVGFMGMVAIVETALPQIRCELDKSLFYFPEAQVVQAKHLHTGAVYQMAFSIQVIQARMGGGVLA